MRELNLGKINTFYDFTGEELFHFNFVRQFTVYEEDEYSHMEQLHCGFLFKPTDELRRLPLFLPSEVVLVN